MTSLGTTTRNPLQRLLDDQGFVVLDGGLATTLESMGHVLDSELWSAEVLRTSPDDIRAVHTAFLDAGADCISTASYQASLPGLARRGIEADAAAGLLRHSVELAVQARDAFWAEPENRSGRYRPLVAASAGPYGAFLADGSEYDGRYGVERDALAAFHHPRLEVLAGTAADVLALETIPSLVETEALVQLLAAAPHPGAWISFSCGDGAHLWDGTAVEDAVRACVPEAGVVAVGVNCTAPAHVASLVGRVRRATDLPILAYPNSGEAYDSSARSWVGPPAGQQWLDAVPEWVRAGARLVGGCCRVGPSTIRDVRRRIEETIDEGKEASNAI